MLVQGGVLRIHYEDIFRAVGNYLDFSRYRDITLVVLPEGFVVNGKSLKTVDRALQVLASTLLFANDDLAALLDQALERRNQTSRPGSHLRSLEMDGERMRYEDALRAIGDYIDTEGWREVIVMQTALHFHIKGIFKGKAIERLLDATAMRELLASRDASNRPKRLFGFRWPGCPRKLTGSLRPDREDDTLGVVADQHLGRCERAGDDARHQRMDGFQVRLDRPRAFQFVARQQFLRKTAVVDDDGVDTPAEVVVDLAHEVGSAVAVRFAVLGHHVTDVDHLAVARADGVGDPIDEHTGHDAGEQVARTDKYLVGALQRLAGAWDGVH